MIERPGSIAIAGTGMPSAAALGRHDVGEVARRSSAIGGDVVGARVGDAEAAAEVELGHGSRGEQLGVHGEQAAGGLGEARRTRRSASRCASAGRRNSQRRRASGSRRRRPGASASGMPNFWSSRAVARYSWVDACTPLLTRRRTRCTRPWRRAASATRSISIALSITIVPTPDAHGTVELGEALVVAVQPEPGGLDPRGERDGELSPAAHVDAEARPRSSSGRPRWRGTPCPRSRPARSSRPRRTRRRTPRGCRRRDRATSASSTT